MPETVTILTPVTIEDEYGNETADWNTTTSSSVAGCFLEPVDSDEGRDTPAARTVARLYCPAGTDIEAEDRVEVRGDVYEVTGNPKVWAGGYGSLGGVVADLARVVGTEEGDGS